MDQIPWSLKQCGQVLESSIGKLKAKLEATNFEDHLVWDKDDEAAMDFVAACANIRANVFNIPQKTRFDIKSMAGNIIPAIATTNAVIAGCIVMEALKLLFGQEDKCREVFLGKKPNAKRKILIPCELCKPNPKCYVCSGNNEIGVKLDLEKVTLKTLEDKILKGMKTFLNMKWYDLKIEFLVFAKILNKKMENILKFPSLSFDQKSSIQLELVSPKLLCQNASMLTV